MQVATDQWSNLSTGRRVDKIIKQGSLNVAKFSMHYSFKFKYVLSATFLFYSYVVGSEKKYRHIKLVKFVAASLFN